jgi:hypothetical protein
MPAERAQRFSARALVVCPARSAQFCSIFVAQQERPVDLVFTHLFGADFSLLLWPLFPCSNAQQVRRPCLWLRSRAQSTGKVSSLSLSWSRSIFAPAVCILLVNTSAPA